MSPRSIGFGIAMAFLALISLAVGVASVALRTMQRLYQEQQSISETEWADVELADEALDYSNRNAQINMEIIGARDQSIVDSLLAQRTENSARISAILKSLQTRVGSAREQELLNAVMENRKAYLASYQRATQLLLEHNQREAARQWLIQNTFPLRLKYSLAWSEYIRFQAEEMNQRLEQSTRLHAASRKKVLYLVAGAVVLALAIGVLVACKIAGEMRRRETAERNARRLNEELELKVQQRTAALETSRQSLEAQVAEREAAEEQLRRENAFFEAQANSTAEGILVVDSNGRKILQNRRFKEIFQLPQQVIDDEDDQVALEHFMGRIVNPEQFLQKVEYLYSHRNEIDRDEVHFRDGMVVDRYSAPVLGHDGIYYGRIWVFRDITERKRKDEVVRRLSLAVEQSPVSVVITDLQGNIVYVNRKFVDITGYTAEEVLGQNPRVLKSGHTSSEDYKKLWETITAGKEWRGEFQNRKKNGELYWEYALITPITDERGAISHFLALKEDITERRAMETQLQRAQKLEAIGQLSAGVAHEINTPMQFIGDNTQFVQQSWSRLNNLISLCCSVRERKIGEDSFQEQLARYDLGDLKDLQKEVPEAIEQTLDGVERVSRIVRAMRDFSHPDPEEKRPTDINHAIETTITVARNEWKYVADVETMLSQDVGLVPCHGSEFKQVILNLLVNAAHAIAGMAGNGSKTKGKIIIQSIRKPNWVEISIRDTGCGIPVEARPHIFELFFTTKEVGQGTGQGLALAHSVIVKKHGGNIWFESEVGKGTTFFIRLPA